VAGPQKEVLIVKIALTGFCLGVALPRTSALGSGQAKLPCLKIQKRLVD